MFAFLANIGSFYVCPTGVFQIVCNQLPHLQLILCGTDVLEDHCIDVTASNYYHGTMLYL